MGNDFEEEMVITLIGENDEERDFSVIDALRLEDSNYLLVIDIEQDEESEELEACILKEVNEEDGSLIYEIVEEEEEFEKLIEMFQENDDFDIK